MRPFRLVQTYYATVSKVGVRVMVMVWVSEYAIRLSVVLMPLAEIGAF